MNQNNRLTSDLEEWLEGLGMFLRVTALNKNLLSAFADGVIVAEVIHSIYPKIIQLHNYSEQNSVTGRKQNWDTLNRKVLKVLRCEVSSEMINLFSNRQSIPAVIDFLRTLRSKINGFEPLYLSGQYFQEKSAQSANSTTRNGTQSSTVGSRSVDQRKASISDRSIISDTNSVNTSNNSPTTGKSGIMRRPSMQVNEKLLQARKEKEKVSRRASLMSKTDMDMMYKNLTLKLKKETEIIAEETDKLEQQSMNIDAKFASLRVQNKEELQKVEKKLTKSKHELLELERGNSLSLIDDEVYYHLHDPQRVNELSELLRQEALRATTIRGEEYDYGKGNDLPDENEDYDEFGSLSPEQATRRVLSPSTYDNHIHTSVFESIYDDGDAASDDSDSPPPPPPPRNTQNSGKNVIQANKKATSGCDQSSSSHFEDGFAVPPPSETQNQNVVSFIRSFSEDHQRYYYTKVDVSGKPEKSQWLPPVEGIVQCKDDSGNIYFTDSASGKSSWKLQEL